MPRNALAAVAITAIVLLSMCSLGQQSAPSTSQQSGAPFDTRNDLTQRHPELANERGYAEFVRSRQIRDWSERPSGTPGVRILTIYTTDDAVFSASFTRARTGEKKVGSTRAFMAPELKDARQSAINALRQAEKIDVTGSDEVVAAPEMADGKWTLSWEFAVGPANQRRYFKVDAAGKVSTRTAIRKGAYLPQASYRLASVNNNDDLASNELHHPGDYASKPAVIQAAGRNNTVDQVWDILFALNDEATIGSASQEARVFTLADRESERIHAAACDDWSVIVVSYMRALNVPAHLRFMKYNSGQSAHAFLEVLDKAGQWMHVDPMWDLVNEPTRYQSLPNRELFEVGFPSDALSTVPVADPDNPTVTLPDPTGDSRLSPWQDFKRMQSIPLGQYGGGS